MKSKYARCGAYHWLETSRSLKHHNAFLEARYALVLEAFKHVGGGNKTVVDVGCGDGALAFRLRSSGAEVVGIDADMIALKLAKSEFAKRNGQAFFVLARAEQLPLSDGCADAVVCAEMIEHIADPHPVLAEIRRVLAPNGTLILSTPYRGTRPADLGHEKEYLPDELRDLLQEYFVNVEVFVSHPVWLKDLYLRTAFGKPVFRWLVNALSLWFGANPFLRPKRATGQTEGYSQILAVAKKPPQ